MSDDTRRNSHPDNPDFWMPGGKRPCWVCGEISEWAYLDVGYQHLDCDSYPTPEGVVTVIGGYVQNDRTPTATYQPLHSPEETP